LKPAQPDIKRLGVQISPGAYYFLVNKLLEDMDYVVLVGEVNEVLPITPERVATPT
jgi:hypothetical protein